MEEREGTGESDREEQLKLRHSVLAQLSPTLTEGKKFILKLIITKISVENCPISR